MRSFRIIGLATLLSVALFGGADRALGVQLTFYFSGTINFVHDSLDLDDSVFLGAPFSGSYSFDPTDVLDEYPDDPRVGSYYFGTAGRMTAQIGNYEFVTTDLGILIWNDLLSGDLYEPISFSVPDVAGTQWSVMSVVLGDRTRMALDSDALVTTVPNLNAFPDARTLFLDLPGDTTGIRGILTSLTPEPGSLAMLAFGAFVVCRRRGG